jgi:flagellar hook-associated protein 1 FlgK
MSNLLASLITSGNALDAYGRVLETAQNNVANASTPGYVKQRIDLHALPFDPNAGTLGGVRSGELESARDEYAEQSVRRQTVSLGHERQMVNSLASLQSLFNISDNVGIPQALNNLFQSFSAWAAAPDSQIARQTVLGRATNLAQNFQRAANGLAGEAQNTEQQIHGVVDHVNRLVGELQGYNEKVLRGARHDAGLDAQMHSALEELSQFVDCTAAFQADGSVTVLLNGNTPLLVGDRQHQIGWDLHQPDDPPPIYASAPAHARILASDGADITADTTGGQLGALLEIRNQVLPSYLGDVYQPGELNRMAKQFADRVNQLLTSGSISDGPPPEAGVALFTYDATNDTAVAQTLSLDPSVTHGQLAAIDPGPPYVSNGIPLALSQLATPLNDADKIDGVSYSEFYGGMASQVGSRLEEAKNGEQVQQSLVTQAKDLRRQLCGVSLNEEAAILIEFQRAYQANARLLTVLDELTRETINLLHP